MDNSPTDAPATYPRSRHLLFWSLAAIGLAADLVTKHYVFASPRLFRDSEWWLWEGHVGIQKSLNEGALFGMGQGQVWLFALISIVAAIGIPVWLFFFKAAADRLLTFSLGAIWGGILGNLYDRCALHGLDWGQFNPNRAGEKVYAVRDWILFQWSPEVVWPNFNIADMLLVVGAALLFLQAFTAQKQESAKVSTEQPLSNHS